MHVGRERRSCGRAIALRIDGLSLVISRVAATADRSSRPRSISGREQVAA
jgi:hypothetical protein